MQCSQHPNHRRQQDQFRGHLALQAIVPLDHTGKNQSSGPLSSAITGPGLRRLRAASLSVDSEILLRAGSRVPRLLDPAFAQLRGICLLPEIEDSGPSKRRWHINTSSGSANSRLSSTMSLRSRANASVVTAPSPDMLIRTIVTVDVPCHVIALECGARHHSEAPRATAPGVPRSDLRCQAFVSR